MTLRAEIHDVVDEAAPPSPDFERNLAALMLERERGRSTPSRRLSWPLRFRGLAAIAAAALVLALMAGLVLSGRIWRDLNAPPPTIDQATLQKLEARPLAMPSVAPGAACPVTPVALFPGGMGVGSGPVYLIDKEAPATTDWGTWAVYGFVYYWKGPGGPVLIRANDLESNRTVVFAQTPFPPSPISPAGRVLGTDHVNGQAVQMRSEAVGQDPATIKPLSNHRYPSATVMIGDPKGSSGCVGLQFDGAGFTETIVVSFASYGLSAP